MFSLVQPLQREARCIRVDDETKRKQRLSSFIQPTAVIHFCHREIRRECRFLPSRGGVENNSIHKDKTLAHTGARLSADTPRQNCHLCAWIRKD